MLDYIYHPIPIINYGTRYYSIRQYMYIIPPYTYCTHILVILQNLLHWQKIE